MSAPILPLRIIASTSIPGSLSIRTMDGGMETRFKASLAAAGFKPGDEVAIVPAKFVEKYVGIDSLFIGPIETRAELREHVDRLWADAGFDADEDDGADFVHVYKNDFRRVLEAVRGMLDGSAVAEIERDR